ncbi:MAG: protein phosphatase 2C domain-containing protein [Bryobacteraceae bacterium]
MPGGWESAAASVIGTSHQKSLEGVCQDSHAVKFLDHASAFVGVVSDGAGSASHAHIGSRLTCDVILREAEATDPARLFESPSSSVLRSRHSRSRCSFLSGSASRLLPLVKRHHV